MKYFEFKEATSYTSHLQNSSLGFNAAKDRHLNYVSIRFGSTKVILFLLVYEITKMPKLTSFYAITQMRLAV